jgi:hypothetical protein
VTLSELVVPQWANQHCSESGIDSLDRCLDPEHFQNYPWPVDYTYNSRGFRDQEWPVDLVNAVWCIGDSFTLGTGCPESHTWPRVLAQKNKCNTINISIDGASNAWIARQARSILNHVQPRHCVIQWSFLHRTENHSFEKIHHTALSADPAHNIPQWRKLCAEFACCPNVVQSAIPNAAPGISRSEAEGWWWNLRQSHWPEVLPNTPLKDITVPQQFDQHWQLQSILTDYNVILVQQKDRARDGFHYDIQTAEWFVDKISHSLR